MSIADIIKTLREHSNMTQDEFAKQVAGVTFQAVSTWERGEREPRMGVIQKLSDYYDIPKSLLIDGSPADLLRILNSKENYANTSSMTPSNGDLNTLREQLRRQPGMRILFDRGKELTSSQMDAVLRVVDEILKDRDDDNI